MKNAKGDPIYKHIEFKVFVGGKIFPIKFTANPGKMFNQANIDHELERVAAYIEEKFPNLEFRMVELLPNRFNFIAVGQRGKVKDESTQDNRETANNTEDVASVDGGGQKSERSSERDICPAEQSAGESRSSGQQPDDSGYGKRAEDVVDADRGEASMPCERPSDLPNRQTSAEHGARGSIESVSPHDDHEAGTDLPALRHDA